MPIRALHPQDRRRPARRLGGVLGRLAVIAAMALGLTPATAATADTPTVTVTAKPTPEGTVELGWTATSPSSITGYEVHRSTAGQDFDPTTATRLYRLPDVTAYLDNTAEAGSEPWYRVSAISGDGTTLATSAGVRAQVAAAPVDKQRTSVLTALPLDGGIRLSWRAEAGAATPLTVYAGSAQVAEGRLNGTRKAGASDGTEGAVTYRPHGGNAKGFALVDAEGEVLATATPARTAHPRLVTPDQLAKVRRIIKEPGTPRKTWEAVLGSLEGGGGSARDAAFAYAVTGDQAYADQAFALFQQAAKVLRTQQTLEVGNTMTALAPAYDLAYDGWTPAQRAEARESLKRAIAYLGTVHHGNIDSDADKSSNWVVIHRGAELLTVLVARGEGDMGLQERRLPVLVDEVRRYLDESYGDSGWSQEGWDYTNYSMGTAGPAVRALQSSGVRAVDAAWQRPAIAELALRTHSLRPTGDRAQFGVGERYGTPSPQLLGTGSPQTQSAYRWLYEHTAGHASTRIGGSVPGDISALVAWPEKVPAKDPDSFPALRTALLDDTEGGYYFRNRTQGDDDVLVGATNRNRGHMGWSQPEAFGLSLIGQGTTWARMPAKENTTLSLFSKPLIDDRAVPQGVTPGRGTTRDARAYEGQGGGFLSLDAHQDYGIDTATREQVTDLRPVAGADAVIALHDRFADGTAHRVDWQLSPEPGVDITYGQEENGARTFLFRRDDAWLKGWLLAPSGAAMSTSNGAFRITRTGTEADFRIVLATGRGTVPAARVHGSALTLGQVSYDTSDLASFRPRSAAPRGGSELPTLHLTPPRGPFMPGSSQEVTAAFTWWADRPAEGLRLALDTPDGWQAELLSPPAAERLRAGQRALTTWKVTAPEKAPAGDVRLAATATTDGGFQPSEVTDTASASLIRTNLALGRPAEQSSTQGAASRATDGNTDGVWGHGSVAHTLQERQPWWQTDLGASADIGHVVLWNRVDCCPQRLHDFSVLVSDRPFGSAGLDELLSRGDVWSHRYEGVAGRTTTVPVGAAGRYVRIQLGDPEEAGYLAMAEVQVLPPAQGHLAEGQPAEQSSTAGGGTAERAVDGNPDGAASSTEKEVGPWWQTDLGEGVALGSVEVWGTADEGAEALTDYHVLVSDNPFASGKLADVLAQPGVTAYRQTGTAGRPTVVKVGKGGRYVRVQRAGSEPAVLSLAEVRVLR
ncbi:discoidin domain-containing protein [Streptomyces pathocidini]|uniref:Discoidin domain-containing protein n=1 Tax=Streptomyces pathocidini TaxID=1650571 RepID=A0ABW7UUR3_9ACTN|nr:discoidin domain-containing protein [Streptomyces pathocidini]